jgi:hypothetical protein
LELSAEAYLDEEHEYQLIDFLKTNEPEVGMLFNFGGNPSFEESYFKMPVR